MVPYRPKVKGVDKVRHVITPPLAQLFTVNTGISVCLGPFFNKHDLGGVIRALSEDVPSSRPRRDDVSGYTPPLDEPSVLT